MAKLTLRYHPHQLEVFDAPARNVVYAKGRRAGGTWGAATRLVELAAGGQLKRHLWVDTSQENIEKLYRRIFQPILKNYPHQWRASQRWLGWPNGAYCDFASAESKERLEGFGYDAIWVNEAGIVLKNEQLFFNTLRPMLLDNPRSRLFLVGAPKGGGLFARLFAQGQTGGENGWLSFRHPSWVNPALDRQEIEKLREQMPEREYRQEILAEFVDEEGTVFKGVARAATAQAAAEPVAGAPYVMGLDLARYGDYTVAWVGRADTRQAVYCDRFHRMEWREQVARIEALSRRFNQAAIQVDATGVGDPVAEDLKAAGLPVTPVVLTAQSKRQLIDHLAVCLEQERVSFYPHRQTLEELAAYRVSATPSGGVRTGAPAGGHDDCVIALALCVWGMGSWGGDLITGSRMVSCEDGW